MMSNQPKHQHTLTMRDLRGWIVVVWVLWWSWAYTQSAIGHRFPQVMAWVQSSR